MKLQKCNLHSKGFVIKFFVVINMKGKKRTVCSVLAILIGAAMMLFGAYRGETDVVLLKAIKICLECIGIG